MGMDKDQVSTPATKARKSRVATPVNPAIAEGFAAEKAAGQVAELSAQLNAALMAPTERMTKDALLADVALVMKAVDQAAALKKSIKAATEECKPICELLKQVVPAMVEHDKGTPAKLSTDLGNKVAIYWRNNVSLSATALREKIKECQEQLMAARSTKSRLKFRARLAILKEIKRDITTVTPGLVCDIN